jgi:hypothetical protein
LQPVIDQVKQENLDQGLYNIYQDANAKNIMIHDYLSYHLCKHEDVSKLLPPAIHLAWDGLKIEG